MISGKYSLYLKGVQFMRNRMLVVILSALVCAVLSSAVAAAEKQAKSELDKYEQQAKLTEYW